MLEKLYQLRMLDVENGATVSVNCGSRLRTTIRSTGEELRLREYQKQQIVHLTRMKRFINGDAVGLGKTLDVIAATCWLKERFPKIKVVVLATKSTTYQWYDEVRDFSELRPMVMQDHHKGLSSYNARYQQLINFFEKDDHDVMIVKYTSMKGKRRKIEGRFDDDGNPVTNAREAISQEIKMFRTIFKEHAPNIILICDEAHKFKTPGSQVRNLVWNLQKNAGRCWALTATAIKNNLEEFYSIGVAIGLEPLGGMGEFREEFCNYVDQFIGQGRFKPVLLGYKRIPEFRNAMRPFFLGRSQAQVKEPLPRLTTVYHNIDLDEETARILLEDIPSGKFEIPPILYKVAGEIFERERKPDNLMTMMSLYQMIANHVALLYAHTDPVKFFTPKLSPKEETLLDLLDGSFRGEKVIVFAQPLTARVLTPFGWRMMKDLSVGDPVVDPDGGIGYVEGIFPQGKRPVFSIVTKTEAKTKATGDHLWLVQTAQDRFKHRELWKIQDTNSLLSQGLSGSVRTAHRLGGERHWNKFYLPIVRQCRFARQKCPISSYILGVLLGDGCLVNCAGFSATEPEIVAEIRKRLEPGYIIHSVPNDKRHYIVKEVKSTKKGSNDYVNVLRNLALLGKHAPEKFIPHAYLFASKKVRKELLAGLLDSDGCCKKDGSTSFGSTSKLLTEGIAALVRSLGGLAHITGPYPPIHWGNYETWHVQIWTPFNPFFLKRKRNRWRTTKKLGLRDALTSIKPAGEEECQCIRVSTKRHLYITDDFIVTHNTKYKTWIDRLEEITKRGHFTERKFLRITGNESEKQRAVNKRLFQDPKGDHDLIVVNSAAMEGVNLQQAAHELLLDAPWSWGDLLQLVGRMVRMASPHSACQLHVFSAKGTVDEYAIETLKGKKGVFDKILGESHSAGILDEKEAYDLTSGLDQCGTDSEFVNMLRVHAKKIGLAKFVKGEKLAQAQFDAGYAMSFETEPKKQGHMKFDDKWNFEEL